MKVNETVEFKGELVQITDINRGWFTIEFENGETAKVRKKDLSEVPLPAGELMDESADHTKITCRKCNHTLTIHKLEVNVKCPECGAWLKVRLYPNLENYVRGLGTTPSGNSTLDINDYVAQELRGLDLDEMYNKAGAMLEDVGIENLSKKMRKEFGDRIWDADVIAEFLHAKYMDYNPGMQRMNVGNVVRAAMEREAMKKETA